MSKTTFRKRQRQQTQQEKRQDKMTRREERKLEKPALRQSVGQEDPDLKGMVSGPQRPRDENG